MKFTTATGSTSLLVIALLAAGCASTPKSDPEVSALRSKLTELQGNTQLAPYAPTALADADRAVSAAEAAVSSKKDKGTVEQLTYLANSKIDVATAQAQQRQGEEQFKQLSEQRNQVLLDARSQEAAAARAAAASAKADAEAARAQAEMLRRQISELNAKQTDRGLVVTLGDVLFATGKSDLKASATANLNKLVAFLKQYPERSVLIEGHTDSTGSDELNQKLSEHRADSVKAFLVSGGIDDARISTAGKGKADPVADNKTASGRQQNRRVEIVIANEKP
jgi:outer membrane protein OmpA-like peptidoglycan-associated protein